MELLAAAIEYRFRGRPPEFRHDDGTLLLNDGIREIAVVARARANKYRNGILARQMLLARQYRLGTLVKVGSSDLCVNCGANIGEVTMWLAHRGARVIAVEPDPATLVPLRYNLANERNVNIVPKGLWNTDGEVTFYQKPDTADTSAFNEWGEPVVIPVAKLDSLMAEYDEPIQLLVGDAEGAEPEVLEGGRDTLKRTRYVSLDVGAERRGVSTKEVCRKQLLDLGFTIIAETRHNKLVAVRREIV